MLRQYRVGTGMVDRVITLGVVTAVKILDGAHMLGIDSALLYIADMRHALRIMVCDRGRQSLFPQPNWHFLHPR